MWHTRYVVKRGFQGQPVHMHDMQCVGQLWVDTACEWMPCREGEEGHFEKAVLYAVNSGGNNMARAALTGEWLSLETQSLARRCVPHEIACCF